MQPAIPEFPAKERDEKLLNYLGEIIELPKKGQVKLSFCITNNGEIAHFKVTEADDIENALYIKELLSAFRLPSEYRPSNGEQKSLCLTLFGVD